MFKMMHFKTIFYSAFIISTLVLNISSDLIAQQVSYAELSAQEQADFSRWLGWIWGDGRPNDLDNFTGIQYTGPNGSQFDNRYKDVVDRLLESDVGLVLANGGTNRRRILEPWDYWFDAIPGSNPGDPQLLRDAVRNPNFLAGIIDTEGGNCGSSNSFYIDDHTHSPFHPDDTKPWGLLNFGPNRIIQLFHLIGDTYGFDKASLQVGTQGQRYIYGDETQRQTAITELLTKFDLTAQINQAAATNEEAQSIRARIYIDSADWDTFRSYGYWTNPSRYPDCNNPVTSLPSNFPLINLPLARDCEELLNGGFSQNDLAWNVFNFGDSDASLTINNGIAEVDIQTLGTAQWHIRLIQSNILLEQDKRYQLSFDAHAEDPRLIDIIMNDGQGTGYFFKTQQITNIPTRYTYEFNMLEETNSDSRLRFNVGSELEHKLFFDNVSVVDTECRCLEERFFSDDFSNLNEQYQSSQLIYAENTINSGSIIYDAGHCVHLNTGFEVKTGAIFEAILDGCTSN